MHRHHLDSNIASSLPSVSAPHQHHTHTSTALPKQILLVPNPILCFVSWSRPFICLFILGVILHDTFAGIALPWFVITALTSPVTQSDFLASLFSFSFYVFVHWLYCCTIHSLHTISLFKERKWRLKNEQIKRVYCPAKLYFLQL